MSILPCGSWQDPGAGSQDTSLLPFPPAEIVRFRVNWGIILRFPKTYLLVSLSTVRKFISTFPYLECSKHRTRVVENQRKRKRGKGREIKMSGNMWQSEKSQGTTIKAKQHISKCVL